MGMDSLPEMLPKNHPIYSAHRDIYKKWSEKVKYENKVNIVYILQSLNLINSSFVHQVTA